MSSQVILPARGFFIEEVMSFAPSSFSDEGVVYVGSLLEKMIKPDNFFQIGKSGLLEDKAFCVQVLEAAMEKQVKERAALLQRAADAILFYSGFFRQKIAADGLSVNYYFDLGRQAYSQSGSLNHKRGYLFFEIAGHFPFLSEGISKLQTNCLPHF